MLKNAKVGSLVMKSGTELKESKWKVQNDEDASKSLKSVPGSQLTAEQRSKMLEKIKGQASSSKLNEQL